MDGFHPQRIVTGRDFLDRSGELDALRRRLELGQNTLLVAPRRFGKSSLIQEAFRRLHRQGTCLYVDLFPTTSEQEAAERILAALYESTATRARRLLTWLVDRFLHLGIVVRHAPTGVELEFTAARREREHLLAALAALEAYAEKHERPVFLALDEFQRVLDWRGGTEAIAALRSTIQAQKRTTYLFSGSKKHVLLGLVEDPGQPFWQQLDVMHLGGIAVEEFAAYARDRFREHGKELDAATLGRVRHWCGDNPKRIQELLQGLLLRPEAPSPRLVDEVAHDQVQGQQHVLRSLLDQVKAINQLRLLKGLAASEDETRVPVFGAAFIQASRLGSPGNVRTALRALQDAGFLDGEHRFTDPYLRHLLRARGGTAPVR